MTTLKPLIAMVCALLAASVGAQDHQHESDEKLGSVNFATSCDPTAQQGFNAGVALLHSFQFSRAIAKFNSVVAQDPSCGIAYWGIALSDWSNPFAAGLKNVTQLQLGREAAQRGKSVGARSERERAYIAAVSELYEDFENRTQTARMIAYRDAMTKLAATYPGDREAQIFYALALAQTEDPTDKTYAGRLKAGAILDGLFEQEPSHPGLAHYIIHTYDVPALAPQALKAARRYAQIAPDAPHALHMPSHTFTRLGFWQDSIDSNIAAADSARRAAQTGEELHASDYEVYAYLQTAQDAAAEKITESLPEIAARFDPKAVVGGAGGPAAAYFALAAIPARYALERQDWKRAEQLQPQQTPFPFADAMTWFARGMGAARLGHTTSAKDAVTGLQQIQDHLQKAGEAYWAKQVEIQKVEVAAWAAFAAGKSSAALAQMQSAVTLEEATEKNAITPGPLAPARELLADMLLQMKKPQAALLQFQATLRKEPRRFLSVYGAAHAADLSGRRNLSRQYFNELAEICVSADKPGRPELQEARRVSATAAVSRQ